MRCGASIFDFDDHRRGATFDQSGTTGVQVSISGSSSNGASVTVVTGRLSGPSQGEPSVMLSNGVYFDVEVRGIVDGNAQVCIADKSVSFGTAMVYWDGTTWRDAGSITVSGRNICGSIPIVALIGTNIALGSSASASSPTFYYALGTIVAAIAIAGGYVLFRRRRKGARRPNV